MISGFEGGKNLKAGTDLGDMGKRILKVSAVTSGTFRPDESKPAPDNYDPPKAHYVRKGDLLFSRANTVELVGATALVNKDYDNLLLPDKLWRFVWKPSSFLVSHYVLHLFKMPSMRAAMGKLSTGTSASMRNISQEKLKTMEIIVPPLTIQNRFEEQVSDVQLLIEQQTIMLQTAEDTLQSLMARFLNNSQKQEVIA